MCRHATGSSPKFQLETMMGLWRKNRFQYKTCQQLRMHLLMTLPHVRMHATAATQMSHFSSIFKSFTPFVSAAALCSSPATAAAALGACGSTCLAPPKAADH